MTFEVEVNGRTRVISVEPLAVDGPSGGRLRLVVHELASGDGPAGDREVVEVDARATDVGLSFLVGAEHRSVDAALTELPGGDTLVHLAHVSLTATVDARRHRRRQFDEGAGRGAQRVVAPMPGRVVRVLVAPGDEVVARQPVIVIEAMKMENELHAIRPGRVREVAVTEGMSVESGRLLVSIE